MSERSLYEVTGDIKDINTLLVSREEWKRRAQPAQAGHDGLVWREIERGADYIKMEGRFSGQPAQPLITSETENTPDQLASAITSESGKAGQVLTDESRRIARLQALSEQVHAHNTVYERKGADLHAAAPPAQAELLTDATLLALWSGDDSRPVLGKNKVLAFARAIEQSVLSKRVPIDFDVQGPQVTVAEDGREPSLRAVLIHYYASHGFNKASAEWAANDYIRLYGIVGEKGAA